MLREFNVTLHQEENISAIVTENIQIVKKFQKYFVLHEGALMRKPHCFCIYLCALSFFKNVVRYFTTKYNFNVAKADKFAFEFPVIEIFMKLG